MNHAMPIVIAHRGASGEAPENTIGAFRLGLEQGCDGFELDVHLSKDGEIVVIHDFTVNRTTDGQGDVKDMLLSELRELDAGKWFSDAFSGERIPTLKEVFDLSPPELMINVEMKGGIGSGLEEALAELLRQSNRLGTVIVSSFDYKGLANLKRIEPSVKIGLLYDLRMAYHWKLPAVAGCEVYSLHPGLRRIDAEDVKAVQEQGLSVFPWTVNEEEKLLQAISYGVNGIITDYPGRLRTILESKSF